MRKNIAAGNWKMNLNLDQSVELAHQVSKEQIPNDVEVILGVPYPFLYSCSLHTNQNNKVHLAAQNCNEHEKGAFTGEVSLDQLISVGVDYIIIGHSERRTIYGESDELLAQKIKTVLSKGLKVIFCCGEPLNIREGNKQEDFVANQLKNGLFNISAENLKSVIIAYEPIWAIGTGKTASPQQAQDMHAFIRNAVKNQYGEAASKEVSILYGGSVKPANAKDLFSNADVDGGLVGGASLKVESFVPIINSF